MKNKEKELTLNKQIENIPEETKAKDREAYASGDLTPNTLQKKWLSEGHLSREYHVGTFKKAINALGFKQQIHGFLTDHPEYLTLFDWEKNSAEGIFPEELTLGSGKKAFFKCSKGLHKPEKRQVKHHVAGQGCSKCAYEAQAEAFAVPKAGRSLLEVYPLVASEFDAAGNEVSSKDVAAKSHKVFAFIPSCGNHLHRTYKQRVKDRTRNEDKWKEAGNTGSWCPWCSNEKESELHGGVCAFLSSLIPLESGMDALVNQMVLPDDDSLPEGASQPSEIDFLSWDLKLAVEIHGYSHDNDPEGYTDSKAARAKELGLDFYVIYIREWQNPERRKELEDFFKVLIGSRVIKHLKKQNRAVSGVFWNGDAA